MFLIKDGRWKRLVNTLKPVKEKMQEIKEMGLANFESTIGFCSVGYFQVNHKGFYIYSNLRGRNPFPPGSFSKENLTRIFSTWKSTPKGFSKFWEKSWASYFLIIQYCREDKKTLEEIVKTWLVDVEKEIESAKKKIMRQTREKLHRALSEGHFNLVAECYKILSTKTHLNEHSA